LKKRLSACTEKALVSDALLLAFSLRRERREQLQFSQIGSRRGTEDERRLLSLICAAADGGPDATPPKPRLPLQS
jgi:hypothetical protein